MKHRSFAGWLIAFAACVFLMMMPVFADEYGYYDENGNYIEYDYFEDEEDDSSSGESQPETEFIPEEYYDPIQTNEITGWPQGPMIQAAAGIVMDLDTGTVLYSKNAEKAYYPASITKIVTAMVALKYGNLDDVITCTEEVYNLEEDASNLAYQPGEKVTMRDALYGLMLHSANELGIAIAVHMAGSVPAFADMMNAEAEALGCVNTHFSNPHGLHSDDHYTCAKDMALLSREAYKIDVFRQIIRTTESSIAPTEKTEETRYFLNHHKMIQKDSDYYQEWCTGGKTGFTSSAWNTLVTFGERDGLRLVCVVLHENGASRAYEETTALLEYGFDNFHHVDMLQNLTAPTFYELIDYDLPDAGMTWYSSSKMEQKTMRVVRGGIITKPAFSVNEDMISARPLGSDGTIEYYYEGWKLGSGQVSFTPLPTGITMPYEQERDIDAILKNTEQQRRVRQVQKTYYRAKETVINFVTDKYEIARTYVEENTMTVILAGAFVLLVFIHLMVIVILRCTKDYRIQRRRKIEERQRRRNEEEIERMSALEIEEELREAMKKDQQD